MDHEFDSNNGYESLSLSLDEYEHQLHPRGNRTRSNSEPSHLDYSLIHEVMSGTPTSKQGIGNDGISGSHADEFSTSPIVTENELPEYESLSSVIRQYNRDSVGPFESINGCSDGNRISFRSFYNILPVSLFTVIEDFPDLICIAVFSIPKWITRWDW
jgi:hypothetical protein